MMLERTQQFNSQLTSVNLKKLEGSDLNIDEDIAIDEQAKTWLNTHLNIDVNTLFMNNISRRPKTSDEAVNRLKSAKNELRY